MPYFTADEETMIKRVARTTWEQIAHDLMEAAGKDVFPRDEVVEVVLDADRILLVGHLPLVLYTRLTTAPREELDAVMRKAFPDQWYGY